MIEPGFLTVTRKFLLPGESLTFKMAIVNRTADVVAIDDVRCSCPCATPTVGATGRLPLNLSPGQSAPLQLVISSQRGERGRVDIRISVRGRSGTIPVQAHGLAEVVFAQALNADPPLASFGGINPDGLQRSVRLAIWSPIELAPTATITVVSGDPALAATFEPRSGGGKSTTRGTPTTLTVSHEASEPARRLGGPQAALGEVTILLSPWKAPERLRAEVTLRAGQDELRIPVLGLLNRPSLNSSGGASMLSRLTADEVGERLLALEAERRSPAALLRTLRARESVARRRAATVGDR